MKQQTLFTVPEKKAPPRRKTAAQRRAERERAFLAFDEKYPEVFERLKTMALALKDRGFEHYGIRVLWEQVRYQNDIKTTGEPYKLCDHMTSFFARKMMAEVPELDGFFEIRSRRS